MASRHAVQRITDAVERRVDDRLVASTRRALGARPRAHMLHIGKTGGTSMKDTFAALAPQEPRRYKIVQHLHGTHLRDIPTGDKVFFVVRDPVDRFVSGFNSRLRRGQPRYNTPWSDAERVAFGRFDTPDALGCALVCADPKERAHAHEAMISIRHVRDSYWTWFESREYLDSRLDDILLIQWLPDLTSTVPRLRSALGLRTSIALPDDELRQHRSPGTVDRHLTAEARHNLEQWYGRDYAFLSYCATLDCFAGPSFAPVATAPKVS
jgi:hypothetical protein